MDRVSKSAPSCQFSPGCQRSGRTIKTAHTASWTHHTGSCIWGLLWQGGLWSPYPDNPIYSASRTKCTTIDFMGTMHTSGRI
ncbi:hypothetical protein GDO81_026963 [Engystomops pustulosus]|uniref:Uncharacterized protein n=1 Tax=Engystomops pustulosus TaxID=76066 RepID=A0AAV6YY96_ENGPU|nr:hypothetical protein GDO81_026963 [Engystomops pustulosus]